jgi:ribonuclease E
VRELTLKSTAPTLVYEEGNLIKRSIRDLFNKDIDEIQVRARKATRSQRLHEDADAEPRATW